MDPGFFFVWGATWKNWKKLHPWPYATLKIDDFPYVFKHILKKIGKKSWKNISGASPSPPLRERSSIKSAHWRGVGVLTEITEDADDLGGGGGVKITWPYLLICFSIHFLIKVTGVMVIKFWGQCNNKIKQTGAELSQIESN